MLQTTTAAYSVSLAFRLDAQVGRLNHIQSDRLIVIAVGFSNLDSYFFALYRTKHEYSFSIDMGDPSCPPPATDQRSGLRPAGLHCDIGAFEFGALPSSK